MAKATAEQRLPLKGLDPCERDTRIRVLAKAESARQAADHLGLADPDTVRQWLRGDLHRLRDAARAASTVWEQRQRKVLDALPEASYGELKKLEARCARPWVIGYAQRYGVTV